MRVIVDTERDSFLNGRKEIVIIFDRKDAKTGASLTHVRSLGCVAA